MIFTLDAPTRRPAICAGKSRQDSLSHQMKDNAKPIVSHDPSRRANLLETLLADATLSRKVASHAGGRKDNCPVRSW